MSLFDIRAGAFQLGPGIVLGFFRFDIGFGELGHSIEIEPGAVESGLGAGDAPFAFQQAGLVFGIVELNDELAIGDRITFLDADPFDDAEVAGAEFDAFAGDDVAADGEEGAVGLDRKSVV